MSGKNGNVKTVNTGGKKLMTSERAAAIQSRTAKTMGTVSKKDFAARAQSAAAHNVNSGAVSKSS